MIRPTKHIPPDQTLLGVGGRIYSVLSQPTTVSGLWDSVRHDKTVGTFERFILALTMLYILRVVQFKGGLVSRVPS